MIFLLKLSGSPLVTGPLALVLNLSAGYPYPQSATDFQFWITRIANDAMRQRYQQIMTDLTEYYQARGYSQTRARLLRRFVSSKIRHLLSASPSRFPESGALGPKDSRNPYGTSTLANSAADNYNWAYFAKRLAIMNRLLSFFIKPHKRGTQGRKRVWLTYMRPAKASQKT